MSDSVKKFTRFQQEHARLHDPALLRGAVELVPVDLNKFTTSVSHDGTKKKKRRHGAAASWTQAKVAGQRAPAPPVDEWLLPADFLRKLDGRRRDEPNKVADRMSADPPREQIQLEVEPQSVMLPLRLFQEVDFALDAPAAQLVELVWREAQDHTNPQPVTSPEAAARNTALSSSTGQPGGLQQVVMDHSHGDHFLAQIGIGDGAYLFGIVVDGHMRPDNRFSQHLLLNAEGLFTPHTLRRHTQKLHLTNKSTFDERVRLDATEPWLIAAHTSIDVSAESSVEATVDFDPLAMQPGLNEALINMLVEREGEWSVAGVVNFSVQVEAGGTMPDISLAPRELGEIRQGIDEAQLQVRVIARGRGQLSGMISLPHSNELADFCLDADRSEASSFTHTFRIESASLPQPQPHRLEAVLNVMLVTDSFLANYRVCRTEIPYRLVYLKKSVPALSFGTVRAGGTKALRLDVSRSDKRPVELTVVLPDGVASYLQAYPARADAYVFRFDTNALPPGTIINDTIELIDRDSGLRDQVKVLATVVHRSGELVSTEVGSTRS